MHMKHEFRLESWPCLLESTPFLRIKHQPPSCLYKLTLAYLFSQFAPFIWLLKTLGILTFCHSWDTSNSFPLWDSHTCCPFPGKKVPLSPRHYSPGRFLDRWQVTYSERNSLTIQFKLGLTLYWHKIHVFLIIIIIYNFIFTCLTTYLYNKKFYEQFYFVHHYVCGV